MANVCIFTAIASGYDTLKHTCVQEMDTDWIAFLDKEPLADQGWIPTGLSDRIADARTRAKWPKIMAHQVGCLAGYDYTIWIDGSIEVTSPRFSQDMIHAVRNWGWAAFRHPRRDCVYDEALAHIQEQPLKYGHLPIEEQMAHYMNLGVPTKAGLFQNTVIVRDMHDDDVTACCEDWWKEIERWGPADQLSHVPTMWLRDFWMDTIPRHVLRNQWYLWIPHRRND